MQETRPDLQILTPDEKVIGVAYITEDDEIIFTHHPGATEVILVEPQPGSSGPWAVRRRPPAEHH